MSEKTPAQIRRAWEALREIEFHYPAVAGLSRKLSDLTPTEREIERQLQAIREVMPSEF